MPLRKIPIPTFTDYPSLNHYAHCVLIALILLLSGCSRTSDSSPYISATRPPDFTITVQYPPDYEGKLQYFYPLLHTKSKVFKNVVRYIKTLNTPDGYERYYYFKLFKFFGQRYCMVMQSPKMDPEYYDGYITVDDNFCFIKANKSFEVTPYKDGPYLKVQIEIDNDYLYPTISRNTYLFQFTPDGLKHLRGEEYDFPWACY